MNQGWVFIKNLQLFGSLMAKRRGPRNYKIMNVFSASMGSDGGQILLASFQKSDAQSSQVSYLNNVQVTGLLQDGDGDNGGVLYYLTTSGSWSDDEIISANGTAGFGGKVSLAAKRRIRINQPKADGDFGMIYLWGEVTDLSYTQDVGLRIVLSTWGRNVLVNEEGE